MIVWFDKKVVPMLRQSDWEFEYKSSPVLGLLGGGKMAVVYAVQCEESGDVEWRTDCSEGWNVTNSLVCWSNLPENPSIFCKTNI